MLFSLLFLSLYTFGWLVVGFVPWLILSVVTRGNAGLRHIPVSLLSGVVGGLAVPLLIRQDGLGLILSFVLAFVLPTLVLTIQRMTYRR